VAGRVKQNKFGKGKERKEGKKIDNATGGFE